MIGVHCILLGDYLAQSRAMFLVNAYLERSQCLASRQTLSVPQIDLSAQADRKMVIFYVYLRYFTKKSRLYRTDMQIKKNGVRRKNLRTPSYAYLLICIFSKEITALGCDFFRKYTDMQKRIRTRRNNFFQTVSNDSFLIFLDFFVILLLPRYTDMQIRR